MTDSYSFSKIDTDETLRETVKHGSTEYPFKYYLENIKDFDFGCVDWHWHAEVEFVYIREGTATFHIGADSMVLSEGTGIFINSGIVHRFESENDCIIPNIVFSAELIAEKNSLLYKKYIAPVISSSESYMLFRPDDAEERACIELLNDVFNEQDNSSDNELRTVSLLMELWRRIYHLSAAERVVPQINPKSSQARLQIMMQYIHENFSKDLSLDDIAGSVSISSSSALAIFRKNIHDSPVLYLIKYRLKRAASLLSTTEMKIEAVACETGFNSSEYFCRKFKQLYNITPTEYRNLHKPA